MEQAAKLHSSSLAVETSHDLFFRGKFSAVQPIGQGHRSGSDALLIAASLPKHASGQLIDMGSGTGVAGLAAIQSNENLDVLLVEKNELMYDLASRTLALPENVELSKRAKLLNADVTFSGQKRVEAGLEDNIADFVIMNPPFNHEGQRPSPNALRAEAHVMGTTGLDAWMRTAAAILKPNGMLVMIYRTEKLGEIIACSQGRFGELAIRPVHSRIEEPAKRLLVKMIKGSRAPLTVLPGIVLHDEEGGPTDLSKALMNGEARIDFSM